MTQMSLLDLGVLVAKVVDDILFTLFVFEHLLNEILFEKTLDVWLDNEDGVVIEGEVLIEISTTDQMCHNIEIEY